jgi:hypothetical protein
MRDLTCHERSVAEQKVAAIVGGGGPYVAHVVPSQGRPPRVRFRGIPVLGRLSAQTVFEALRSFGRAGDVASMVLFDPKRKLPSRLWAAIIQANHGKKGELIADKMLALGDRLVENRDLPA